MHMPIKRLTPPAICHRAPGQDTEAVQNKPQLCTSQWNLGSVSKTGKLGKVASGRANLCQISVQISWVAVATPNGIREWTIQFN